jgi:mRNA-degrading endonuclease RelE of RelBE toxin-antitoxin system
VQIAFREGFRLLAENPFGRRAAVDVHQLRGGGGLWTLRVGKYRGIYRVIGSEVVFVAFRPRPTAYRNVSKL